MSVRGVDDFIQILPLVTGKHGKKQTCLIQTLLLTI